MDRIINEGPVKPQDLKLLRPYMVNPQTESEQGEKSPDSLSLKLVFSNEALKSSPEAQLAQMAIYGLNLVEKWSLYRSQNLLGDEKEDYQITFRNSRKVDLLQEEEKDIANLLSSIHDSIRHHYREKPLSYKEARQQKVVIDRKLNKFFKNKQLRPKKDHEKEILIEKPEDLEQLLKNKISLVLHDIRNPLTVIQGYVQLINRNKRSNYRKFQEKVNHAVNSFRNKMKYQQDLLRSDFVFEGRDISIKTINELIFQEFFSYISAVNNKNNTLISTSLINDAGEKLIVEGSDFWLGQLLENIAQNTYKAFKKRDLREKEGALKAVKKEVLVGIKQSKEDPYLEIIITDNAIGYPDTIVENGFENADKNKIGYGEGIESTGTAMERYADIMAKLKGQILARNITHEDGSIGAQTIIRLPIKKEAREAVLA
ncbi:sensor histidine kinase [Candidatus Microgenomates bacterium]|nr:MAG: sensor histidine kinase [Candidatus Microgenomates bacterium]